jgi:integrase/recombinase XerD
MCGGCRKSAGWKPSTVSRRMAVVTGFYRTCVIDAVLEHSPTDYVRRPFVPAESPTLGLSHLQFEALLSAARESPNLFDFALVTMLGLLGLRIFEACGANITDLGEEHGRGYGDPERAWLKLATWPTTQ